MKSGKFPIPCRSNCFGYYRTREICMVGDTKTRKVDVRILAATNKDLTSLVKKNIFREDLYFRLNVINIEAPPLRERDDDILILASHFAEKFIKEMDRTPVKFTERALNLMQKYHWQGNVRELENVIQRLVVMTDNEIIDAPDFPEHMRFSASGGIGLNRSLSEMEAEFIG